MSSAKRRLRRLREGAFSGETLDKIAAWITFVGVPAMVIGVAIMMVVLTSWISDAKEREEHRVERLNDAVEQVIQEVRNPHEGADTREQTFDRIRQLCEIHEGCDPRRERSEHTDRVDEP